MADSDVHSLNRGVDIVGFDPDVTYGVAGDDDRLSHHGRPPIDDSVLDECRQGGRGRNGMAGEHAAYDLVHCLLELLH
jgi:hypothetical protein